jgi:hypothetical protein
MMHETAPDRIFVKIVDHRPKRRREPRLAFSYVEMKSAIASHQPAFDSGNQNLLLLDVAGGSEDRL